MADILVIDDEENLGISMQLALKRAGHTCRVENVGERGLASARSKLPDLIFVDVNLPDTNGLELLGKLRAEGIDTPVIVITGFGTIASAVAAMQQGAVDYIQKPLSMDEVVLSVERCLENRSIRNQLDAYREAQQRESQNAHVIGDCGAMRELLAIADKIGSLPLDQDGMLPTVLLLGDTGTGKEALARYIHHRGASANRPFVHVNCTAVPESLFESELFGHEAGAFTHAKSAKKGLFEVAEEGTLFLDEIGDMPLATQSKLLVAIESGRFRRLGGTTERVTRSRVMAATNSDLEGKIEKGEFRADLFYRLKVFCLHVPPLRDRGDDIILLADHFLDRFRLKFRKPHLVFSDDAVTALRTYHWPGNVREVSNVIQRTALLADGTTITAEALNLLASPATPTQCGPASPFDFESGDATVESVERRLIQAALAHTQGNISETARVLGLSRGSLRHRLDKLGMQRDANA
ncbi:MAG: sigma-54-dependent Fis family transcriptional regulator [Planctomycetes bacterium]|nr:sigma-54-dependent Fis family transcriptional regulator [Planctomycetota bacterium]